MLIDYNGQQISVRDAENPELVEALRAGKFPGLTAIRSGKDTFHINLSEHVPFVVKIVDGYCEVASPVGVFSNNPVKDMQF